MKKRFSERNNLISSKEILAPEALHSPFRKAIFNTLYGYFRSQEMDPFGTEWQALYVQYQREFLDKTLDEIKTYSFFDVVGWLKGLILSSNINQVFDFIELILDVEEVHPHLKNLLKDDFEIHQIEYAIDLDNQIIIPKISKEETKALKEALEITDKYPASKAHLEEAIHKFSQGKYSKSIAEAVHSVESLIRKLTNDDKVEIPEGLRKLSQISPIHGAFSGAINKLYAYAGDVPGARHSAISLEESVTKEDAQFILVTSSAFITYLTDKFGAVKQEVAA